MVSYVSTYSKGCYSFFSPSEFSIVNVRKNKKNNNSELTRGRALEFPLNA